MRQYSIGLDFGTLSARAVLMDVQTGEVLPEDGVYEYPHGVLETVGGKLLPADYAIEHPADYDEALAHTIRNVLDKNGVDGRQVIGIGMDCTACSVLPVDERGEPLAMDARFADNPHAYLKLWKHHGAEKYMDRIKSLAEQYGESFPSRCGTGITSEFFLPKVLETAKEAPEVYDAAHRFMHVGDYLCRRLTSVSRQSAAYASIKSCWDPVEGFPTNGYLRALNPRLEGLFENKTDLPVVAVGGTVGTLNAEWAQRTGLHTGVAVAVPIIDAHAALGMAGLEDGTALAAMGTSACLCMNASRPVAIPGVMSCGMDAMASGWMTYDAGLSCVGDLFDWFVKNQVPAAYEREAEERGVSIHTLLTEKAAQRRVGENGLLCLGWWNGNRCTLADGRLSGLLLGLRLSTRPEDIYRALLEASAYGLRCILENYIDHGVPVHRIVATGGIAKKNPLLMQILSDVTGREIEVLSSSQSTAGGSAVYGAVAGGAYADIQTASAALRGEVASRYTPIPENVAAYETLFAEYLRLRAEFGEGKNTVMHRLCDMRK